MLIIGEKFNSSIPFVKKAMQSGDQDRLANLAVRQAAAGADYLDLNTAVFLQDEVPKMREVLEIILKPPLRPAHDRHAQPFCGRKNILGI